MATGDRDKLEAMANRVMGPYVVNQQLERQKLQHRERQGRVLRLLGICLLVVVSVYLMLR